MPIKPLFTSKNTIPIPLITSLSLYFEFVLSAFASIVGEPQDIKCLGVLSPCTAYSP